MRRERKRLGATAPPVRPKRPRRTRRRLSDRRKIPLDQVPKCLRDSAKELKLPRSLDRKKWTKAEWDRLKAAWAQVDEELALVRRHMLRRQRKFAAQAHANQKAKADRLERKKQREAEHTARIQRKVAKRNLDERVLSSLTSTRNTVARLAKFLEQEPRAIRQSLKRSLKAGKVIRTSPRCWAFPEKKTEPTRRPRKRLSDVQPRRRRKRL